jgi:SAM-dependent methyltransferase
VVDGIPVLLVHEARATHGAATRSLQQARESSAASVEQFTPHAEAIDPYVQQAIAGTNGIMWKRLRGKLRAYPIPALPLPRAGRGGAGFLDVGCNWGRWCLAAGRLGYDPVGIDVSLEAVRAAYRVAEQLGVEAQYLVADARTLPFREQSFPVVFSYSVLQHFQRSDADEALAEVGRVTRSGGTALIQMANRYGVRSLYHQARRGFRRAEAFEVRYWSPGELRSAFERSIGPARVSADGYFSLNAQECEMKQLPLRYRCVVKASASLRAASSRVRPIVYAADSLWVCAVKGG